MTLIDYYNDIAGELKRQSDRVRSNFKTHRPSAGDNREAIVGSFLEEHLPMAFGVDTGLVLSRDNLYSNQADIVVVDQLRNAPLYSSMPEKIWLVESVYSLIEVKTSFTPTTLNDAIIKCRRFKTLKRDFLDGIHSPSLKDSLFIIWAFEAPSAQTVKKNLAKAIQNIPISEQPDFIVVPDSLIAKAGSYHALGRLGMPNSPHRNALHEKHGKDLSVLLGEGFEVFEMGQNALLTWLVWFTSWLTFAGPRTVALQSYLPPNMQFGNRV